MSVNKNKIVLSVDDVPEILMGVKAALKDHYNVYGVCSATDAINFMNKRAPDLFILDIDMPFIDGYDLAALIRMDERYVRTPIIFLTGYSTHGHVMSSMQAGGNDYVVKPINHKVLLDKVNSFLAKKL